MKRIIQLAGFAAALILPVISQANDPGKPDMMVMDSVQVKQGDAAQIAIKILADDTTHYNDKAWIGVGSFCLPLLYDRTALTLDSARFVGAVLEWDEKFTNAKIDTGFVSFAGIYNVGGGSNPVIFSPDKPEEIIRLYVRVAKNAKPGTYEFALTQDPIQKEAYLGSIDGFHSWKPGLVPGKIVVK